MYHARLVALAGNQTLSIMAEMLDEVVTRAVTAVSKTGTRTDSVAVRRRGIRSQRRLAELVEAGDAAAAEASLALAHGRGRPGHARSGCHDRDRPHQPLLSAGHPAGRSIEKLWMFPRLLCWSLGRVGRGRWAGEKVTPCCRFVVSGRRAGRAGRLGPVDWREGDALLSVCRQWAAGGSGGSVGAGGLARR